MVLPAPADAILIDITGDTTGFVTGTPPNVATGDLDATITLPNPGWTPLTNTWAISDTPSLGTATIDFATGAWTYTIDPDEFAALDDGELVFDTFEVEVTAYALNPSGGLRSETSTQTVTIAIEGVCFVSGTMIESSNGPVPVERLEAGDMVQTLDNGFQPVRWIESSVVTYDRAMDRRSLWPVRIARGALSPDVPRRDLYVSQQHRMLVGGPQTELLFGTPEVLTSAKSLCHLSGIDICEPQGDIEYVHVLLDEHEILNAEGAPAESLFLGEETLCTISSDGLQELFEIFGDKACEGGFSFGKAARMILTAKEACTLSA